MVVYTVGQSLDDMEKQIIIETLKFFRGNKTSTAQSLKVSLRGLDGKIKRLGIEPADNKPKI